MLSYCWYTQCYCRCHFSVSDAAFQVTSSGCQSTTRSHPCFSCSQPITRPVPVLRCGTIYSSYLPIWSQIFYKFCEKYKIHPLPASSLTLQFYCANASSHTSHKTLKYMRMVDDTKSYVGDSLVWSSLRLAPIKCLLYLVIGFALLIVNNQLEVSWASLHKGMCSFEYLSYLFHQ